MLKRPRHALLLSMMIMGLFLAPISVSYAQTVDYTYDPLNRLEQATYPDGHVLQYTYDPAGNRVGAVSPPSYNLTVAMAGSGDGTVASTALGEGGGLVAAAGINCGSVCTQPYPEKGGGVSH